MSVRWRHTGKDKNKILCAAVSKPLKGDTYIDDHLHYKLAVELMVLLPIKDGTRWKWKK